MPRGIAGLALGLTVLGGAVLTGCGGDDGGGRETASTGTSSLDPGVSFEDDVTVPTDPSGEVDLGEGTVPLEDEVVTEPGQVPPEFPADFPVPEGAAVEVGSQGRADGELRLAVDYAVEGVEPSEVTDFYRDAIAEAGFSVLLDDDDGQGQDYVGLLVFETDTYVGNVLVAGDGNEGVLLTLTATLPD